MKIRIFIAAALAVGLQACATGPSSYPVQATRYHFDAMTSRGTILVEPMPNAEPGSLEFRAYATAVEAELTRLGFTVVAAGAKPENLATIAIRRAIRPLPSRRSGLSIGVGGGGFSGGGGGGVGVGAGVTVPVGGKGAREGIMTEISVRIRRGPDAVWEGTAQSMTVAGSPSADTGAIARRLASAMFSDFPGESGRTIEVR